MAIKPIYITPETYNLLEERIYDGEEKTTVKSFRYNEYTDRKSFNEDQQLLQDKLGLRMKIGPAIKKELDKYNISRGGQYYRVTFESEEDRLLFIMTFDVVYS